MKNSLLLFLLSLLSGLNTKLHNQKISKDLLKKLTQVKSLDDFRQIFNIREPVTKRTINGTFHDNFKRDWVSPVECKPRPIVVPIGDESSSKYLMYPACVMADRCSGCEAGCSRAHRKHCAPTTTLTVPLTAYRIDVTTHDYDMVDASYENHTKCACLCVHKPTVCWLGRQTWNNDTCECTCPENARVECSVVKQWSDTSCDCICTESCRQGETQDKETCACTSSQGNSNQGNSNQEDGNRRDSFQEENDLEYGNKEENDDHQVLWDEDAIYDGLFPSP